MPSTSTSPTSLPSASSSASDSIVRYLAPSSSSETASSSPLGSETAPSATTSSRWDVFVNFRGETRRNYVDFVYRDLAKIPAEVFLDDRALVLGEKIKEKLKEAIRESKIYVVVFSEDYASSTWCLEELAEIYKCHTQLKRPILAVYYKIEPSVVRYQKKSFKQSFEKHEARSEPTVFTMEDIQEWRRALKGVAGLSGETIPEQRYKSEAQTVTAVVERIQNELIWMRTEKVADHPVGLDSRISEIQKMLERDGVTEIGIYGMGGVGKSTLARAVFNKNLHRFERCSFLKNVRESSATEEGKLGLQRQLIRNILKSDTIKVEDRDHAKKLITYNIPLKEVLIVVDDLENREQFKLIGKSFAPGSKIIITTRNEDLLESMGVREKYKVDELSNDDSDVLFAEHTELGDIIRSDTFTEWRRTILDRAGGLPEAVTAFGNELMRKELESEWKYFINLLDHHSHTIIDKCLLISYDSLKPKDNKLQDLFVNIACSHIGREKQDVVEALDPTSSECVETRIHVLEKRSLLTISSNSYTLGMHILLTIMGRRIQAGNGSNINSPTNWRTRVKEYLKFSLEVPSFFKEKKKMIRR